MNEKRRREIEAMRTIDGMWVAGSFGVSKAVDDLLAEIDRLTPDAELGEAVRGMPENDSGPLVFWCDMTRPGRWAWAVGEYPDVCAAESRVYTMFLNGGTYDTPDAALKAAGLWPED